MVATLGVEPSLRGYEPLVGPFHYIAVKKSKKNMVREFIPLNCKVAVGTIEKERGTFTL